MARTGAMSAGDAVRRGKRSATEGLPVLVIGCHLPNWLQGFHEDPSRIVVPCIANLSVPKTMQP
jgi:hypothetical protein